MKKSLRIRTLSLALCLLMVIPMLCPNMAALEIRTSLLQAETSVTMVDPRYDHLTRISSGLDINRVGWADCAGAFTTYDTYDSTVTITLMKFVNGSWDTVKEWNENFTGSGMKSVHEGCFVGRGRYRLNTIVQIWDGSKEIEKVYCPSPIQEF